MGPREAGRVLRTVAHLRPAQVLHRLRLSARRAVWVRRGAAIDARYRGRAATGRVRWDHPGLAAVASARCGRRPLDAAMATARDALAGRFTLLGETKDLGVEVAWDRPDLQRALLWKTHLHEFGWSFDLARAARESGDPRLRAGFFALARAWRASQPIAKPGFQQVAWNERVVATRLVHWAAAGSLLGLRAGDPDADWLARALVEQALFLRDNLALDLQANHLFRDCFALAFGHEIAGCAPEGLALLEREVGEQILPDGAHYERSPMYHGVCLEDLIDLQLLLGERAPGWLGDAVRRAAGFLESLLLGDGDIPLLGDAWRGEIEPGVLLQQARQAAGPPTPPRAPESHGGLVRLACGPLRAVIRAGAHGPDHQLGHAHADLLSFDLSCGPRRVVTDTGTGMYADGPERRHLRSTAAHNTLQLDGAELLEAWSSFRSGRRGRARCEALGGSGPFQWIHASHDAWRWLAGAPVHHRLLAVAEDAALVLDVVLGGGRHRVASALHLHPDGSEALRAWPLGGDAASEIAPLHERFGQTRPMTRLRIEERDAALPWLGGWWLVPAGEGSRPRASLSLDGLVARAEVEHAGARIAVRWDVGAPALPSSIAIDVLASRA